MGLRKGLVDYDKERYTEERNNLIEQLTNREIDIENEGIVIQMDVQQLQDAENDLAENEGDEEAYNFSGYGGIDEDGAYYEDDRDNDFNED